MENFVRIVPLDDYPSPNQLSRLSSREI
jgi:hypothetical protein